MRAETLRKKIKQTGLLFYAWVRISRDRFVCMDIPQLCLPGPL